MATGVRSLSERRHGGKAMPGFFLSQLAAALDNPAIRALEWHEDGQGVVVHPHLYEEEVQKHKELFPELKTLWSVSMLQAWLLTAGFRAKVAKAKSDVLIFQHSDFRKLPPRAEEVDGPSAEPGPSPRQHKKAKKRKSMSDLTASAGSAAGTLSSDTPGADRRPQRLRPLYQYINYDNPEMNRLSEEEGDTPETAVPGEATTRVGKATANMLEASGETGEKGSNPAVCSVGTPAPPEVDKSTQVAIDKMLSVCAAHLVPPLSPQHK